jgi:hypothetical protein
MVVIDFHFIIKLCGCTLIDLSIALIGHEDWLDSLYIGKQTTFLLHPIKIHEGFKIEGKKMQVI